MLTNTVLLCPGRYLVPARQKHRPITKEKNATIFNFSDRGSLFTVQHTILIAYTVAHVHYLCPCCGKSTNQQLSSPTPVWWWTNCQVLFCPVNRPLSLTQNTVSKFCMMESSRPCNQTRCTLSELRTTFILFLTDMLGSHENAVHAAHARTFL